MKAILQSIGQLIQSEQQYAVQEHAAAEITLRQVLDWAFFVEKHGNEVDWLWLTGVLEEFGLRRFFDVLNAICVEDLGFAFGGLKAYGLQLTDVDKELKERVLGDILEPEFSEEQPKYLLGVVPLSPLAGERLEAAAVLQREPLECLLERRVESSVEAELDIVTQK